MSISPYFFFLFFFTVFLFVDTKYVYFAELVVFILFVTFFFFLQSPTHTVADDVFAVFSTSPTYLPHIKVVKAKHPESPPHLEEKKNILTTLRFFFVIFFSTVL